MTPTLLSLLTILTPITEPLILTTGEKVNARHLMPSDEFCLSLEEFALVQADQIKSRQYWEGRLSRQRARFIENLTTLQESHKEVHKSYLAEQEILKGELKEAYKQRDLARHDLWWWRGATVGLILSTGVTVVYLIGK